MQKYKKLRILYDAGLTHYNCSVRSYTLATSETWMNSIYSIAVRLLDFDQSTVFFVGNSSFTPRKL